METVFHNEKQFSGRYNFSVNEISGLREGVWCVISSEIFVQVKLNPCPSNILKVSFYNKTVEQGRPSYEPNNDAMHNFCNENTIGGNLLDEKRLNFFSFSLSETNNRFYCDPNDLFSKLNKSLNSQIISLLNPASYQWIPGLC